MATRRVMANSDIIPPLFDKSRKEIVNSSTIGIDFLGNALSNDIVDIIYEGTRLKWCNDLDSLKAFVAEVLDLNGKWCSPGGGSKGLIPRALFLGEMRNISPVSFEL
jgi:hypothetical protein